MTKQTQPSMLAAIAGACTRAIVGACNAVATTAEAADEFAGAAKAMGTGARLLTERHTQSLLAAYDEEDDVVEFIPASSSFKDVN